MTPADIAAAAEAEAVNLALRAGREELLAGAADPEIGPAVLADLLAHEIAATHKLMLRLAAATHAVLGWSAELGEADRNAGRPSADSERADLAAARLAGGAPRLMESARQGLVALARCRPQAEGDDGIWIALNWLDGRCSPEELDRRLAKAKAARAANDPEPPKVRLPSPRAQELRALAGEAALEMAAATGVGEMARLAADERRGLGFLCRLFAHELGAGHALMMQFACCADHALDRSVETQAEPVVALKLSGVVARLGDRFRRGVLTLQRLSGGGDGKPPKVAGMVWAGRDDGGYKPAAPAPANDAPDAAATAGHGVLRSVSPLATPGASQAKLQPRGRRGRGAAGVDATRAALSHSSSVSSVVNPSTAGHGVDRSILRKCA